MSQLIDWFGNPIVVPAQPMRPDPNINPCLAVYGTGPEGKQCSDCAHLIGICKAKTFYKCNIRANTHGAKTDHKRRYPACGRFVAREGAIPLYDGRN